jgi:phosphate-selective porin
LSDAIERLQRSAAPPDTRRGWSAPRVGGRIFIDSVNFICQNDESKTYNNQQNAAGFRELRLGASGTGYDSFEYRVELSYNAQGGIVVLTDNWIGARNVPLLGYFRVGHWKPETGQYNAMGSQNVTSMDYAFPVDTFSLGRKIGISSENLFANDRMRIFFGVFQNAPTNRDRYAVGDNQGQVVNLRMTGTPVFEQDGKYLFHVGGHWAYVGSHNNQSSLGAKPGSHGFVGNTLQSGTFANKYSNRGGVELAYQSGRFSARSEFYMASFGAEPAEDRGRKAYGTYVELGYFLTDSFRVYNQASGLFTGVEMNRNFRPYRDGEWNLIDGLGAWQSYFQWAYVDMTDWRPDNALGGYQNEFVTGLNWYWTPHLRWMFQYTHSRQCVGAAFSKRSQDIFGTSLRVHF